MSEDPQDPLTTGRLRAEDRRGLAHQNYQNKKTDDLLDPKQTTLELEETWDPNPTNIIGPPTKKPPKIANPITHTPSFIETATPTEISKAVQQSVMGFMNAQSHQERIQHLISGHLREAQLKEFYQRPQNHPPNGFAKIQQTEISAFQGIPMHSVFALEADQKSGWFFNLLPTQNGMKIDWESSVAFGEIPWTTFTEEKPTNPVTMRVLISRSRKDKSLMPSENIAFCKIFRRGNNQSLPGFFQIDSTTALTLKKIIPPGGRQPVKAKLRWNPQGTAIEVVEVLHNFWIDVAHYQKALLHKPH